MTTVDVTDWPHDRYVKLVNWADGQDNFEWFIDRNINGRKYFVIVKDEDVTFFMLSWAM